jgi:hypothetical protein
VVARLTEFKQRRIIAHIIAQDKQEGNFQHWRDIMDK